MTELPHTPHRPDWTCRTCDQDWPCPPARVALGEEYARTRTNLGVYMAAQLSHAVSELPVASPAELYERFIAWTRPPGAGT